MLEASIYLSKKRFAVGVGKRLSCKRKNNSYESLLFFDDIARPSVRKLLV
jgi:hypothetical protein